MKTKHVVYIALIGALYAVLTVAIAPLSYGPIQFRVSEFLKVFCLFNPLTAVGIAMGDILSASISPFVSLWELIFMPVTDILGGYAAYTLYKVMKQRFPVLPMVLYSMTTAVSVGYMLTFFGLGGFWILSGSVLISEIVILAGALPIGMRIRKTLQARNITLMEL